MSTTDSRIPVPADPEHPREADPALVAQIADAYRRIERALVPGDLHPYEADPYDTGDPGSLGFYVRNWMEEEFGPMEYHAGCPDWGDREALIFTIEAARLICGVEQKAAAKLLRMAADELEAPRSQRYRHLALRSAGDAR